MDTPNNEVLQHLIESVANYCDAAYAPTGGERKRDAAHKLVETVHKSLPGLANAFRQYSHSPDIVFAKNIIDFAVAGLNDPATTLLWKEVFLNGMSYLDVAELTLYSSKTIQRRVASFPERVSIQLWEKNMELVGRIKEEVHPSTVFQRQAAVLIDQYKLSNKEAEIVLTFCQCPRPISRRVVADILVISENTLKTHIKGIVHKMNVTRMNEAVAEANRLLRTQAI